MSMMGLSGILILLVVFGGVIIAAVVAVVVMVRGRRDVPVFRDGERPTACPGCGAMRTTADKYCGKCGHVLPDGGTD